MRNVYKRVFPLMPHNWLGLSGLANLFILLFYATGAVGLYAVCCWAATFFTDPAILQAASAPIRRIYGLASIQALLVCVGWWVLIAGCRALNTLMRQTASKEKQAK